MSARLTAKTGGAMLLALALGGCGSMASEPVWKEAVAGDGPGDPALLIFEPLQVTNLPKSKSGNRPEYEVFGIRYSVLDSAKGFQESGTASWYGSKFHGNATASGEIYDMHQLTAAHKHLPLPTFVRVTRQDNGQSIVVKVNDRGPFVNDRIIDLSYGAASALDMLGSGKAAVHIEALSHHDIDSPTTTLATNEAGAFSYDSFGEIEQPAVMPTDTEANLSQAISRSDHFVQVGAFSDQQNAQRLMEQLTRSTSLPSRIDFNVQLSMFQVRVGPFFDDSVVHNVLQILDSKGIKAHRAPLIAES